MADDPKAPGTGAHPAAVKPPEAKSVPATFNGRVADLSARLDAAAAARDADAIDGCYKDLDALKPSKPEDDAAYVALARRFAHYAPRKLARIKAIEASLDAGLSNKGKGPKVKVEHPAVTKAKADLAALEAEHSHHVTLPEDAKAIEALQAKLDAVPLHEEE